MALLVLKNESRRAMRAASPRYTGATLARITYLERMADRADDSARSQQYRVLAATYRAKIAT